MGRSSKEYFRQYNAARPTKYYHEAKREGGARWQRIKDAQRRADQVRREKFRSSPRAWVEHNITRTRGRCRREAILFDLHADAINIPTHCPITGTELNYGSQARDDNCPSFDRIRPELGYVDGNVRIISRVANRIRQNCVDPAIFEALAADARSLFGG